MGNRRMEVHANISGKYLVIILGNLGTPVLGHHMTPPGEVLVIKISGERSI